MRETLNSREEKMQAVKPQLIVEIGGMLHDEWRAPRKKPDGTFEPRIKKTKDEAWKQAHNTEEVDIANTGYEGLPEDWKGENKISAEIAVEEIYKVREESLDESFVEVAAAVLHEKWMERKVAEGYNAEDEKQWGWAKPMMVPYEKLPDEEKEKDRRIVKKAIEVFEKMIKTE